MAQLISYELAMALSIIPVIMCSGSLNLIDIVNAQKDASYF
jgi:NADH-quinone oxidoreductase subunit H